MHNKLKQIQVKKHIFRKIAIPIFSVWAITELLLLMLATPILKNKLKEIVERESKGVYSIDFDYISVEPISRSFRLINFKLSADTAKYNYLKKESNVRAALYQISFSSLNLRTLHIYKLFEKDIIEFKKIEVNNPIVNILALPKNDQSDSVRYDAVHKDLYASIKPYAKALIIRKIHLNYGHFNLNLNQSDKISKSTAEEISIKLYNFMLDSVGYYSKSKLFYSDSLTFILNNYRLKLNDEIHNVFASEITISLGDSTITVKNAHIFPDSLALKNLKNKSFYDIKTPTVKFTGADIHNAWFNKDISIRNVEFDSAKIVIKSPGIKNDTIVKHKNLEADYRNIFPLIQGRLTSVSVDDFKFSNASFEFHKGNSKKPLYTIEKLNFSLKNFEMDSLAYKKKNKILYAENFVMDVQNYHMKIFDNTHEINVDQLYLSTEKKVIFAVNLSMQPLAGKTSNVSINMKIPFFRINNADFIKAYNTGELEIGELISDHPAINVKKFVDEKKKNTANPNIIFNIVSEYLNTVKIDKLSLEKGNLSFTDINDLDKNAFINSSISLHLRDFILDQNTATRTDRIFYASGFDLLLNNLSMKSAKDPHILKAQKIRASTIKSILEVENLEYKPIEDTLDISLLKKYNKRVLNYFEIEKLAFNNVDIKNAIFKKILKIDNIYIKTPKLSIKKYTLDKTKSEQIETNNSNNINDSVSFVDEALNLAISDTLKSFKQIVKNIFADKLNEISVNFFKVDSGYLDVSNFDSLQNLKSYFKTNITAQVNNFYFNKDSIYEQKPVFTGNTNIYFSNFNVLFPNKYHKIRISNITFLNKDSSLTVDNLRVFPDISNVQNKIPIEFMFYTRHLKISGIDIENAFNKKGLNIRDLFVDRPYISFAFNKNLIKQNKITKNKQKFIPINLKINKINIFNGKMEMYSFKDSSENLMFKTDFDVFALNTKSDTGTINDQNFPIADSSKFVLRNIEYWLPDSTYALNVDSLVSDLNMSDSKIYNVKYFVRDDKNIFDYFRTHSNQTSLNFNIRQINIQKLDLYKLIFENKIIIDNIALIKPLFIIEKYKDVKKAGNNILQNAEQKIQKLLTKKFNLVSIKNIEFTDLKIKHTNRLKNYEVNEIANVSGNISNFEITKKENPKSDKILFSSDISVSIKDYHYYFPKKFYSMYIKNIEFSTKKSQFIIDSLQYLPIFDKYYFAKKEGIQKSVMFLNNANIVINDFNIPEFFKTGEISSKKILLKDVDLYIFKDMHFPEDTLKRPKDLWLFLDETNRKINIDEIEISNSNIVYEQNSLKYDPTGILKLSDINGNISNITNDSASINKSKYLRMKLNAKLQDSADLKASFRFPLNDKSGIYSFAGTVDTFDIKILNSFLENTSFVSIKSGKVNKVTFFVDVNDKYASGKMHLFYNDLAINILDTAASSKNLVSFFANSVIPSGNPKNKLGKIREGKIYYERVEHKPMFSLWTKSVLSGASSTLGFKSKQLKKHLKLTKRLSRFIEKGNREKEKNSQKRIKEMKDDIQ